MERPETSGLCIDSLILSESVHVNRHRKWVRTGSFLILGSVSAVRRQLETQSNCFLPILWGIWALASNPPLNNASCRGPGSPRRLEVEENLKKILAFFLRLCQLYLQRNLSNTISTELGVCVCWGKKGETAKQKSTAALFYLRLLWYFNGTESSMKILCPVNL